MRLVGERKRGKRATSASLPPAARPIELCLSIGPTGVGLGLARPVRLGPLWVRQLEVGLPGLAFPLDVSGGVHRFRHRRGELRRLTLGATLAELEAWAAPALRDLVDAGVPVVRLAAAGGTLRVSVASPDSARRPRVLVFEVACRLEDEELELVAFAARGAHLPGPAARLAGEALARTLGKHLTRRGSAFSCSHVATRVAATLLPEAGARAPRPSTIGPGELALDATGFVLTMRSGRGFVGDERALHATEAARLSEDADTRLAEGDLEGARAALLAALARAPRHPELTARLIALDALVDGRGEAARATLREAEQGGALRLGDLPTTLLLDGGAVGAAHARAVRDAEREPDATLRALLRVRAAELEPGTLASLSLLDEATCDAPDRAYVRRGRLACALAAGRLDDADADGGFLEAMGRGPAAKCRALVEVGLAFVAAGHAPRSSAYFERALRYVPDDLHALTGLGAALSAAGDAARAATVLARAVRLASSPMEAATAGLALARLLEAPLGDLSAAVARAAEIPADAPEGPEARILEARVRARVGDHPGAVLALARFRDGPLGLDRPALVREAVRLELEVLDDRTGAGRTLERALGNLPLEPSLLALQRDLERPATTDVSAPELAQAPGSAPWLEALSLDEPASGDHDLEARVEPLIERLRADPTRDEVVDELVLLLTRLGRGMELLALLSARLDDAPEARRPELVAHQREVLLRLEHDARAAGRSEEASLFAMSREMLG